MDWLAEAIKCYKSSFETGYSVHKDVQKAMEFADANSTAGPLAREKAQQDIYRELRETGVRV